MRKIENESHLLHWFTLKKTKLERNQVKHFVIFITRIELFGWHERVIEEAIGKVKKKFKTRFACIGTGAFAWKVNVITFILMKTVIFICRGRECRYSKCRDIQGQPGTYKDSQGQTRTSKNKQGQAATSSDKQRQAGTDRDRQRQKGTSRDRKGLSLFVSVWPCLVPACPCLSLLFSLLVPACPCVVPYRTGWRIIPFLVTNIINFVILVNTMAIM